MRRLLLPAVVAALMVAIGMLIGFAPASAMNDPHRIYLAAAPFTLTGGCSFPVDFAFPVNKEYATASTGPDGSTIYTVTGSLFVSLTNADTGKTITVNASGPGTVTVSADGTTARYETTGRLLLYSTNATDYGFPSNIVLTSGPSQYSFDYTTSAITSMSTQPPHVLLDACAALSP